ncbi:phenazine biosynthesis protein PhzF [Iodobacter sp. BJB302]|nr:phenazine biosynthesis protein PhzF [Iodobacter sp. BJB302]
MKAYTLNAFAKTSQGGNPAGVVFDADALTESQMLEIARIIGFSETAFVMKSSVADFKVRFFTPTDEVDLCGHATIATFYALAKLGFVRPGQYIQETKAGLMKVVVADDLAILMDQQAPSFFDVLEPADIAASLNLNVNELMPSMPVQIVSTGIRDIMVPVKSLKILHEMKPDFDRVADISRQWNVVGFHIFTLETMNGGMAHCRNLAPLYGIPEESATGTSNGALASYLFQQGLVNALQAKKIVIEQGYSMEMPSEIVVSLTAEGNSILQVKVGGKALNLTEREIELSCSKQKIN